MIREEYPRPQWKRKTYQVLNGAWQFAFDDEQVGSKEKWYQKGKTFSKTIEVPFAFQSEYSGIHDTGFHDVVWYKRCVTVPKEWNQRVLLHFGAVDYESWIYVNGEMVGTHKGGNTSFTFDITDYLTYNEEEICVRCFDPSENQCIPRGKQYWKEKSDGIWYTRTSGIWQTVWLEPVHETHLDRAYLTPNLDEGTLSIQGYVEGKADRIRICITEEDGTVVLDDIYSLNGERFDKTVSVFQHDIMKSYIHNEGKTWSPEHPYLYDISFELYHGEQITDYVESYFGMRKIHSRNGIIYLNNRPYTQKLVLDQGYFPKGLLTAPQAEDFRKDILLAKQMGFNGCRKHQKVEDPLFLYYADKEGFLVWGEMANAANFSEDSALEFTKEWCEVLKRDYNHPSIICWVPLNESWGVPDIATSKKQQNHALNLYHLTKTFDSTRLVISNDGWEMTRTDICAIHNYAHGRKDEPEKQEHFVWALSTKEALLTEQSAGRAIYVEGFEYQGEPILLTEFGGIAYTENNEGWGYTVVASETEFLQEYERLIRAIGNSEALRGFVYTQLTDVEQEINGLLRYDRTPKFSLDAVKKINDSI